MSCHYYVLITIAECFVAQPELAKQMQLGKSFDSLLLLLETLQSVFVGMPEKQNKNGEKMIWI